MRKRWLFILLSIAVILLLIRIYPTEHTNQPLKVYVIFQEDEGRLLLEKFKNETGQPYEIIRMSGGEAIYHLIEMNTSGIDVVLGGPADLHEQLKNKGKLLSYSPRTGVKISEAYKDENDFWTGMYRGALAIGVNERVWKNDPALSSLPLPETYEDLLRPELYGKIEIPDPETSGTGYTLLASLAQERGEEQAVRLMYELKKQSSSTTFSGISSAQRLAVGEVAAVVSFLGDQLRFANSGYSIHSSIPPQAGWEVGGISIIKSSTNKKAAKKLLDFMLSRDAQTIYMNSAFSLPIIPGIKVNPLLESVEMENLLSTYRFDIAAANHEELIQRWREVNH